MPKDSTASPLVVLLFLLGGIFVLPIAVWMLWGWLLGAPLVQIYAKISPDIPSATYQCGSSEYKWEVAERDEPEWDKTSLLPIPRVTYRAILTLVKNGERIAESDVPDSLFTGNDEKYGQETNFHFAQSGWSKTYVMGREEMEVIENYRQEGAYRTGIYRGVILSYSKVPFEDFDIIAQCLRENIRPINAELNPGVSSDHVSYFSKIGWISYQFDSSKGKSPESGIEVFQ